MDPSNDTPSPSHDCFVYRSVNSTLFSGSTGLGRNEKPKAHPSRKQIVCADVKAGAAAAGGGEAARVGDGAGVEVGDGVEAGDAVGAGGGAVAGEAAVPAVSVHLV